MIVPRDQFVEAVRSLVGTPYQHRGRIAGQALDCVGVPIAAMALCGVVLPEPPPYGTVPGGLLEQLAPLADQVVYSERAPGDLLAIWWAGEPRHLAVVVDRLPGRDIIVHAKANLGRVAAQSLPAGFRVHSVWRLRRTC